MWIGINQVSEQLDSKQIAHTAILVHIEMPRAVMTQTIPLDHDGNRVSISEIRDPVQFHAPLVFLPSTHQEPPANVVRSVVQKYMTRPTNEGWQVKGYVLAVSPRFMMETNPWLPLKYRGWYPLCEVHTALLAHRIREEILSSTNSFYNVDGSLLDKLCTIYSSQPSPIVVPAYYRTLVPALQKYFSGIKQFIIDGEQPDTTPATGPGRRIVIDDPATTNTAIVTTPVDSDPVPPTQTERMISTVREIIITHRARLGLPYDARIDDAASMFEHLLLYRQFYNNVIENNLIAIRQAISGPDSTAMLDELLDYIHTNNTWES